MTFQELKTAEHEYIAQTYARYDLGIDHGIGATCYGLDGRKYIDFTSGIGVNSLGYCDSGWVDAVASQLHKLQHASNFIYTQPCAQAAKLLCERGGMKKVFFANSGAEANEGAIKCARKYSRDKYGPGRHVIVSLVNSFHGRTLATLSATGQASFHANFDPFPPGFDHAPAGDLPGTLEKLTGDVCAVMLEMVQGEGGIIPLSAEYVQSVAEYCAENDILVIVDEIQSGIGRVGALFAYQLYGLSPDIATAAKGLGGGLPVGAVLFGEKTQSVLGKGDHGTTFGGNPVACAGVNYVLSVLDDAALDAVVKKGEYIRSRLLKMPHIVEVGGLGLMIGATLSPGVKARDVVDAGVTEGVITLTAKERFRLLPPLTITMEEIEEGLERVNEALKAV